MKKIKPLSKNVLLACFSRTPKEIKPSTHYGQSIIRLYSVVILYSQKTYLFFANCLILDSRDDITILNRHFGWKSNQTANEFNEDSTNAKKYIKRNY